jgi:hypothetical protein
MQTLYHTPTKFFRRGIWARLSFGHPDNPPGQIMQLKSQANFLRWRHFPPDCHLPCIKRTQLARRWR